MREKRKLDSRVGNFLSGSKLIHAHSRVFTLVVIKMQNGEWLITGGSGIALIVSGTGQTMREAQRQMYGRIQNVLIPNMYYRTDIGDRWYEDSDKLHAWGVFASLILKSDPTLLFKPPQYRSCHHSHNS